MSLNYYKNGILSKLAGNYSTDTALSNDSVDAVQNKVVTKKFEAVSKIACDTYDITKLYNKGSYCIYKDIMYKCIADATIGITPDNTDYWAPTSIDSEIKSINSAISNCPVGSDTLATSSAAPRDADTLGGLYSATDITSINESLANLTDIEYNTERVIGTYGGKTLYEKVLHGSGSWNSNTLIDSSLNFANVDSVIEATGFWQTSTGMQILPHYSTSSYYVSLVLQGTGILLIIGGYYVTSYDITIRYTKK